MKAELLVDIEDMSVLAVENNEEYAMNRKRGFGASDSSILLGVNKWTKLNDLIEQKNLDYISDEELEVGQKPQVRMGADLEPIILAKAAEFFQTDIAKPNAQYRFKEYPFLTINYDGAMYDPQPTGEYTPPVCVAVEAKCVSSFARKYWGWDKSCKDLDDWLNRQHGYYYSSDNIKDIVEQEAEMYGIPPYYYTQVQQQMIGTNMPYCALVALDVKNWEIHVFKIFENDIIQQAIVMNAAEAAERCNKIPHDGCK